MRRGLCIRTKTKPACVSSRSAQLIHTLGVTVQIYDIRKKYDEKAKSLVLQSLSVLSRCYFSNIKTLEI